MKLGHPAYFIEQSLQETKNTLAMEWMNLTEDEIQIPEDYNEWKVTGDELRKMIFFSIASADRGEATETV